ncbi:MAG: hypothetical protein R2729_23680 [Bryobacteraceae bacterium]
MTAPASREHGLDYLRVAAFAVLILYHSGMAFVSWGWHLKNPETSPALEAVMLFFNIIHQTITVAAVYFITPHGWNLWIKFALVAFATFAGSWVFYELVRRTALTRLLFGMKPSPVTASGAGASEPSPARSAAASPRQGTPAGL